MPAKPTRGLGPLHPQPAAPVDRLAKTTLGRERQLELYRYLQLTRRTEARLGNLYRQGKVVGGLYSSLGQEAVAVGSVGLSEATARELGYDVAVGKFPFSALGKARILGHTEGFVKLVRETKYDEVLGVHIIGAHATDLIAEACVALRLETTVEEIARTIHPHPTLSEALMQAAEAVYGHAIDA